jgi:hypothetical protein
MINNTCSGILNQRYFAPGPSYVPFSISICLSAALMLAGRIQIKNRISNQPVISYNRGSNNPIAAAISISPVPYTSCFLNGIKSGIIKIIPLVSAKCPRAVNNNITLIAILPESKYANSPIKSLVAMRLIIKTPSRINKGFICSLCFNTCHILSNQIIVDEIMPSAKFCRFVPAELFSPHALKK